MQDAETDTVEVDIAALRAQALEKLCGASGWKLPALSRVGAWQRNSLLRSHVICELARPSREPILQSHLTCEWCHAIASAISRKSALSTLLRGKPEPVAELMGRLPPRT